MFVSIIQPYCEERLPKHVTIGSNKMKYTDRLNYIKIKSFFT